MTDVTDATDVTESAKKWGLEWFGLVTSVTSVKNQARRHGLVLFWRDRVKEADHGDHGALVAHDIWGGSLVSRAAIKVRTRIAAL